MQEFKKSGVGKENNGRQEAKTRGAEETNLRREGEKETGRIEEYKKRSEQNNSKREVVGREEGNHRRREYDTKFIAPYALGVTFAPSKCMGDGR